MFIVSTRDSSHSSWNTHTLAKTPKGGYLALPTRGARATTYIFL